MKLIPLTKGMFAMVDDADYPVLSRFKWHASKDGKTFYPQNVNFGRMHSVLVTACKPLEVDHIDRNGLNNQRSNLRICTHQQNNWNQGKKKPGTSKYKGVSWFPARKKWMAKMRIKGKNTHLGCFQNEDDAAKCYDKHAALHFGEFACFNFR